MPSMSIRGVLFWLGLIVLDVDLNRPSLCAHRRLRRYANATRAYRNEAHQAALGGAPAPFGGGGPRGVRRPQYNRRAPAPRFFCLSETRVRLLLY